MSATMNARPARAGRCAERCSMAAAAGRPAVRTYRPARPETRPVEAELAEAGWRAGCGAGPTGAVSCARPPAPATAALPPTWPVRVPRAPADLPAVTGRAGSCRAPRRTPTRLLTPRRPMARRPMEWRPMAWRPASEESLGGVRAGADVDAQQTRERTHR